MTAETHGRAMTTEFSCSVCGHPIPDDESLRWIEQTNGDLTFATCRECAQPEAERLNAREDRYGSYRIKKDES